MDPLAMTAAAPPAAPLLPYGFAKRHGVVVLALDEAARVGLREGADPLALTEARRVLGRPLAIERLSRQEFERRLSETYAGDGLGDRAAEDLDMPGGLDSLAEEIPAAADLLDSQDDAPIIRLINGVIAEAIRRELLRGVGSHWHQVTI
ncbi:MAG TPA: hypothetical protein PKA17_06865, partial [Phenylobacterium sp.]|nr:hypothetical protein [Phenylobacterium sp.]